MRLDSLKISNFRSILEAEFSLDKCITIFIGGNDSGKSNILKAIRGFREKPQRSDSCHFSPQYEKGKPPSIEATFSDFNAQDRQSAPNIDSLSEAERKFSKAVFCQKEDGGFHVLYGSKSVTGTSSGDYFKWLPEINTIIPSKIPRLKGTIKVAELQADPSSSSAFDLMMSLAGANPSAFKGLGTIEIRRMLDKVNLKLTPLFQQIWRQDSEIKLDLEKDGDQIDVIFRESLDTSVPFSDRGDGLQWLISLWVYIEHLKKQARSKDSILLLDEPDVFLHPRGQQDLMRLIEGWSEHFQIILTTHSPFVIDANHLKRIRLVDKGRNGTNVRSKYDFVEADPLRSTLGTFASAPFLLGQRNVFVEGVSDQIFLSGMAVLLSKHNLLELDLNQTKFIVCGSDEKTILRAVNAELAKLDYCIVVDSDAKQRKRFKDAQKVYKIKDSKALFLGDDGESIEDTFPPEDYIEAVNLHYIQFSQSYQKITGLPTRPIVKWVENELKARMTANGDSDISLDKVGVALKLIELLNERSGEQRDAELLKKYQDIFREIESKMKSTAVSQNDRLGVSPKIPTLPSKVKNLRIEVVNEDNSQA
jgi:predicted ATP-dependent endonuclease of OLD family